uniref:PX domain-containing protein n=1 Tax=Strigamia maritima TaxID=126957 RepID=T1JGV2_STRMM
MASDQSFGSVPQFYNEIYNIICPTSKQQVDRDIFVKLLIKSSLPSHTLIAIWDLVDKKQGYLTRNGLYKSLALIALAQQGKQIGETILDTYNGQDLPKPLLGDLSDLRELSMKLRRVKNPTRLEMEYSEICSYDTINIEIIPEKKGLFLKHVEYEISSQRQKTQVRRRYNDFVALHDLLLLRFPYRSIPRLPPKRMMGADAEFIEERRRCLKRYLTLICRHPIISEDRIVSFFLSFVGQDAQSKMRESFRNVPDEYVVSELALRAKELVPLDTHIQYSSNREQIGQFHASVCHIKEIAERIVSGTKLYSQDMTEFGRELTVLSTEKASESAWGTGGSKNWFLTKKTFRILQKNFAALSESLSTQTNNVDDGVVEDLNLLVDFLIAYKDLCDRHEKGVQQDHQRALTKMLSIKKKLAVNSVRGPDLTTTDLLETRIVEHENQILNMENRNYFSLHCIHMETQLVYIYMDLLHKVVQTLAELQTDGHNQLSKLWEEFQPILNKTFQKSVKSPTNSRPTSPINTDIPSNYLYH